MENTFLPGTVRERIADLMKYYKVSQTDLALKIGCGDSLLSRFLTGKTDKLGDENIIRIVNEQAQAFIIDLFGKLRERMIDLRSGKAVFVPFY